MSYPFGQGRADEQKQAYLDYVRSLPEEGAVAALDSLATLGWPGVLTGDTPIITVGMKHRVLEQIRYAPSEEGVASLDQIAGSGWLFAIPIFQSYQIDCKEPHNEHVATVHRRYECTLDSSHRFCLTHNPTRNSCPICGGALTTV
jgi:hypothetical protein